MMMQETSAFIIQIKREECRDMRQYKHKILKQVFCNKCGKELKVENGILKEGCFKSRQSFDYFSDKDGIIQEFDLCEKCYDDFVETFQIPVSQKEETELL